VATEPLPALTSIPSPKLTLPFNEVVMVAPPAPSTATLPALSASTLVELANWSLQTPAPVGLIFARKTFAAAGTAVSVPVPKLIVV
jgi:hypothetical protein